MESANRSANTSVLFRHYPQACKTVYPQRQGGRFARGLRFHSAHSTGKRRFGGAFTPARACLRVSVPKLLVFLRRNQPFRNQRPHDDRGPSRPRQPPVKRAPRRHRIVLANRAKRLATGDALTNLVPDRAGLNRRASRSSLSCWHDGGNHGRASPPRQGATGKPPRARARATTLANFNSSPRLRVRVNARQPGPARSRCR